MSAPRQPLDREEVELARLLRGLPAAEPGADIDARILAAARAAPARRSPVRRPWIWSLGTAAAAVLAFGTLLRMQQTGIEPLPEQTAPMLEETAPPAVSGEQSAPALDRIEVSGSRIRAENAERLAPQAASEMALPAAPPAPPVPSSTPAPASPPRPSAADAQDRPAEPSALRLQSQPAPPAPAAPPAVLREASPASTDSAAQRLQAPKLAAPPPGAAAEPESRQRAGAAEPGARESAGSMAAKAFPAQEAAEADAPPESDEALFERVRLLLAEGHAIEARRLLRAWRSEHPDAELPDDLKALLE